jgi:hypothetical protein
LSRKQQPFWKPQAQQPSTAPYLVPKPAKRPPHIMVAVFTGTERSGWVHPSLTATLMRLAYDPRLIVSYVPIHAIHPVCQARNTAVEDFFLKSDAETLVIFDNDVAPPQNVADAIVSMPEEAGIAVLPYWVWLPVERHTMPCFGYWEDSTMVIPDPATLQPGWQKMGAGGTGAMFIRRKVFTEGKLARPFFKILSSATKGQIVSEDIWFTGRAAEAGYPTWLNTDFVCSHFHTIDLADINLGIVKVVGRFHSLLAEKYGDIGVTLNSLVKELHPELLGNLKEAKQALINDTTKEEREAKIAESVATFKAGENRPN